jgi:hypothetical protein
MRFTGVAVAAMTLAGGCAHEHLPWPPPPDDVARINEAAREENNYLRVEYVDPLFHKRETSEMMPVRIEAVDPYQITFRTRAGDLRPVAVDLVKAVAVRDRARGALVGMMIGLGAAALELTGSWLLNRSRGDCDFGCGAKFGASIVGINAGAGLVLGYVIGGRRTFHFDFPVRTPPAPVLESN